VSGPDPSIAAQARPGILKEKDTAPVGGHGKRKRIDAGVLSSSHDAPERRFQGSGFRVND